VIRSGGAGVLAVETAASRVRYDLLKVLLVDDNHHMRVMLTEILRAIGVRTVYEAGDGAEGLQMLRNHPVDLIMTDLAMAPLDGIDFVRLLRQTKGPSQTTPVIMITGHSTLARVKEARNAGVNEFLAKPMTARGVLDRVALVIDQPRAYVRTATYFGPDRRRHRCDPNWEGPWRREDDRPQQQAAVQEI
jgi:two-component system chemotaxis response regulator CheY